MSTSNALQIPRRLVEEMLAHAEAERPNECCGLLAGLGQRARRRYPLVNAAASPALYEADPRSLFAAFKEMRREGTELLAIYHSHPTSPPVPSRTDLARNGYGPEVVHFIVSLLSEKPELRGWHLEETVFREAAWTCVDEDV